MSSKNCTVLMILKNNEIYYLGLLEYKEEKFTKDEDMVTLYENGNVTLKLDTYLNLLNTAENYFEAKGNQNVSNGEYTTVNGNFTLVSKEGNKDNYGYITITGEVKNNTNKTFSYAQITFTLYDESGAQVGTVMDNINNFEANGTWKFKAIGLANNSTTYRCTGITGW